MSFNNIVIVFVKGNGYRIPFWYMSKDEVINITENSDLEEKSATLENCKNFKNIYEKLIQKLWHLVILKSKSTDFTTTKIQFW